MPDGWMAPVLPKNPIQPCQSTQTPGAESRAAAARLLHAVRVHGQSLNRLRSGARGGQAVDYPLVQDLVYGSLRHLMMLSCLADHLLERPLKARDAEIYDLVLIGLYQLGFTQLPLHAAVSSTVEAARTLGKPHLVGLVNALLRRFMRERPNLLDWVARQPAARWPYPSWLIERLRLDWPDDWEAIIQASQGRAPMTLRVNPLRQERLAYLAKLESAGIPARAIPELPTGILLDQPCPMRDLPGWAEGWFSVQDSGAQLAAVLLDAQAGERVLDACAAPGGKTAAILEHAGGDLDLIAIDQDPARLATAQTLLRRLGLKARLLVADAANPQGQWTDRPFDRILLDVPCSATGVIRRHPDIPWLRRLEDISALAATQGRMLEAIWPLLRPGGRLLYATCTLLALENAQQVTDFLARHPEAQALPLNHPWGRSQPPGVQLLPTPGGHDGFFYALIEKTAP